MATGMVFNLALLSSFKYLPDAAAHSFLSSMPALAHLAMPLGISFWTFQAMSYLLDLYRGEELDPTFLEFALYMVFFPVNISGPICRMPDMLPQIRSDKRTTSSEIGQGLRRMATGIFMVQLAKLLGQGILSGDGVNSGFDRVTHWSGPDAWCLALGFGLQLFLDFAGYSHIAIGAAKAMGFTLPENFDRPFHSASPSIFWTRWHMSLSFWIRDYVFLPLATMRREMWWRNLALVISMVMFGVWHRASVLFLLWGLYHGVLLVLHRQAQQVQRRLDWEPRGIWNAIGWVLTMALVNLGWIFFRTHSLVEARQMLAAIFSPASYATHFLSTSLYVLVLSVAAGYGLALVVIRAGWRGSGEGRRESRCAAGNFWRDVPLALVLAATALWPGVVVSADRDVHSRSQCRPVHVQQVLIKAHAIETMSRLIPYRNLIEALEAAPGDRPFATGWIDEDEQETVTFADFRGRARAQAALLRDQGMAAGDRVIILMPQGIRAMAAFAGAMMLGAVPAFLAYPNFKVEAEKYRSGLAGVSANLKAKAVVIDEDFPEDMLSHVSLDAETKLIRAATRGRDEKVATFPDPRIQPEDVAFIQHSAGTTGLQKGVALTHSAVLRQLEHLMQALQINPATDRICSWLPLYHDMGLIACFVLPMVCQVPVVMQSPLDWVMHPESMLQIISDYKCTLAWLPNFAFQFVPRRVPAGRRRDYDLSSLRALINCSEPVRASSLREFQKAFGVPSEILQSSYAMAENVFAVTQSDLTRPPAQIWADGKQFRSEDRIVKVEEGAPGAVSFTSSGRLLPRHGLRVVSDAGEFVSDGVVGELLIQSDCLFEGYYNRPDLTQQAMVDGWYRTGDLGFSLDGEVYVVGRKKDLLIIGGENVYPQDIEELVAGHPAVHDGRVIALGLYNADLGTEEMVVVAEVENEALLGQAADVEQEIRSRIVGGLGVAARTIVLKPAKWIVKSTAGKPARSATREKLMQEHPELNREEVAQ